MRPVAAKQLTDLWRRPEENLEKRTGERLAQPGGNVHYERFAQEVIPHVRLPEPFCYRVFDCGVMDYHGERQLGNAPIRIVEGSYSFHPALGNYADILVFSTVSPDEQIRRIQERNGDRMLEMFKNRWIPMEEAYFAHYRVMDRADVVIGL